MHANVAFLTKQDSFCRHIVHIHAVDQQSARPLELEPVRSIFPCENSQVLESASFRQCCVAQKKHITVQIRCDVQYRRDARNIRSHRRACGADHVDTRSIAGLAHRTRYRINSRAQPYRLIMPRTCCRRHRCTPSRPKRRISQSIDSNGAIYHAGREAASNSRCTCSCKRPCYIRTTPRYQCPRNVRRSTHIQSAAKRCRRTCRQGACAIHTIHLEEVNPVRSVPGVILDSRSVPNSAAAAVRRSACRAEAIHHMSTICCRCIEQAVLVLELQSIHVQPILQIGAKYRCRFREKPPTGIPQRVRIR